MYQGDLIFKNINSQDINFIPGDSQPLCQGNKDEFSGSGR